MRVFLADPDTQSIISIDTDTAKGEIIRRGSESSCSVDRRSNSVSVFPQTIGTQGIIPGDLVTLFYFSTIVQDCMYEHRILL